MPKRTLLLDPTPAQVRAVRHILGHDVEVAEACTEPDYKAIGAVDLVVGSPSIWVEDPEASYDDEFEAAVSELRPEIFLLETVRGLMAPKYIDFLTDFADDLADFGYTTGFQQVQLGSAKRKVSRTILIGRRDDLYPGVPTFVKAHRDPAVAIANLITENLNVRSAA